MEARYYRRDGDEVVCELCPHGCVIPAGKAGLCGVRRHDRGVLMAENYGQISSLALDPIEKKPLNRFYPGHYILSAGSYGCNMACGYCQNSAISRGAPETRFVSPEELTRIAMARRDNLGLAFTYNEPLVCVEYLLDAAPLLKGAGLKAVLVTNGMIMPEPLNDLLPYIDAMNIDLKGFTESGYRALGGDLQAVKDAIERSAAVCHVEVSALIVPGLNDSDLEMDALSAWLASISPDIPLHINRFFPRDQMAEKSPTPVETLHRLKGIAGARLKYVYVGNV